MAGTDKNTVLVVDDEHTNIMALRHILRPDFEVYADKTGKGALETAQKLQPDVILLDVIMPNMDGYDVIKALKDDDRTRDIPVIFITGLSDVDSEEKGLLLGAVDYITKPFIPDIVRLRVQNQFKIIEQTRDIINREIEAQKRQAKLDYLIELSHETLTPMNVIMGMTKIAKRADNQDEMLDCLDDIDVAANQLLELIMNLLEQTETSTETAAETGVTERKEEYGLNERQQSV